MYSILFHLEEKGENHLIHFEKPDLLAIVFNEE